MNQTDPTPEETPADEISQQSVNASDTPSEATPLSEVELLQQQLEAITAERDAHYDKFLRSQAELDNFRKRSQKEVAEIRQYQSLAMARDLLPVVDNLHRAIAAAEQAGEGSGQLAEGIKMVAGQLEELLNRHAVQSIEALHQPFDPNLHEAVQQLPSPDHDPMTVLQELQRGYTMHDRVIRPAQVIVSSTPPE